MDLSCDYLKMKHPIAQKALYALLEVKDSDLRLDTVYQGNHAVDQGIHIGGTFSELIPLIALFYGGFIHVNVEDPTARESDIYVQSKGHGIAGMASVFSDFGFFDRALLENSRGSDSDLNGHPGPILPGVHIATGPLGQGISAAVGFAMAQKIEGVGRTFCLMGDGELQEGIPWEAFMFASAKNLNNLCILIDHNYGQNDDSHRLMLSMGSLREKLESFGFDVLDVNGQEYEPIYHALEHFQHRIDSRPMAIISECRKGEGGFSKATESHKTTVGHGKSISRRSAGKPALKTCVIFYRLQRCVRRRNMSNSCTGLPRWGLMYSRMKMALWVLYAAILNAAPNGLLPETRLCITRSATYPIPKSEISCSAAKLPRIW